MWLPDGQAIYFDGDHQMFPLAMHAKDPSARVEPAVLPIKGFAQAEYRRQFDLMTDGRRFLLLLPIAAAQGRQGAGGPPPTPGVDMKAATKLEVMAALRQSMSPSLPAADGPAGAGHCGAASSRGIASLVRGSDTRSARLPPGRRATGNPPRRHRDHTRVLERSPNDVNPVAGHQWQGRPPLLLRAAQYCDGLRAA